VPGKILVLTGAEQVEHDATEFKFSKLVLHIALNSRMPRKIVRYSQVYLAFSHSVMRSFLCMCAIYFLLQITPVVQGHLRGTGARSTSRIDQQANSLDWRWPS
jgi:hypothetical protein